MDQRVGMTGLKTDLGRTKIMKTNLDWQRLILYRGTAGISRLGEMFLCVFLASSLLKADAVTQISTSFSLDTRLTVESVSPSTPVQVVSDSFLLDTRFILANTDPVFPAIAEQRIPENSPWAYQLAATDAEFPRQALSFSKIAGPASLIVTPEGQVQWTPDEESGGSVQTVRVQVTDGTSTVVQNLRLVVQEDQQAPQLLTIADATIRQGQPWTATAQGKDSDIPSQSLAYSLVSAIDGFVLDSSSGVH